MSEFFARNALLFAGEAFVMSAVVLALAWEASHMVRSRASLRHLVWGSAFAALLLLPVLALLVPTQIHFAVASAPSAAAVPFVQDADIGPDIASMPAPSFHIGMATVAMAIIALWLAGVLVIALRGLVAMFGLRALERRSRVHVFEEAVLPDLGRRYEIRVADAPNGLGPITWGLFRPVILLPFPALFWTRERLQAVLLHEAAHIRRHDSVSQMLSLLVCALYWPNPLVWLAARALRNEAEIAADDQVIAAGMRPSSYAGELLQLASEFRSRQPALAGMPLFMAAPSALEARVKSVLAPTQSRSGVTSMDVLKIGGVAIMAAAALTVARPSFAQEEAAPPVSAVESAPLAAPATPASPAMPASAAQEATPPSPAEPVAPPTPVKPVAEVDRVEPAIKVHRSERIVHGHRVRHVSVDIDTDRVSAEALERVRPQIARAEAEARAVQAQAMRAEVEVRAHEAEIRALQAEGPRLEAEVQAALAKVQPEIDRAIAEARLNRMDVRVQEQIDRAMQHARVHVEMRAPAKPAPQDARETPNEDAPNPN
jgi:beta-lactamase regulating signal transducer with metallopeptidase domain